MITSEERFVVCIDGPAGSGKSTVASEIANKLGLIHLNSGALFRALALEVTKRGLFPGKGAEGISLDDEEAIVAVARNLGFDFVFEAAEGKTRFFVDGVEPGDELYSSQVSMLASEIAVLPTLREYFLEVQRDIAAKHSVIVEGRDAGTVVFPDARFKFYLVASLDERARRRFAQLTFNEKSLKDLREELDARDKRDESREVAPQRAAEDAVLLDTSDLNLEQVVDFLMKRIQNTFTNL